MFAPIVISPENLLPDLKKISAAIESQPSEWQGALKQVGVYGLQAIQDSFIRRAETEWEPIADVTALLRRRGRGKKIVNEADLQAKKKAVTTGQDTGMLLRSFHNGDASNILTAQPLNVTFGSKMDYAVKFHEGGISDPFNFDERLQKRFFQNVQVKIDNPRGSYQKIFFAKVGGKLRKGRLFGRTGRKLKKKVWSEFAWWSWFALSKRMPGNIYDQPERPIWEWDDEPESKIRQILEPLTSLVEKIGR